MQIYNHGASEDESESAAKDNERLTLVDSQRFEVMMEWNVLFASLGQDTFDLLADATVPAKPSQST